MRRVTADVRVSPGGRGPGEPELHDIAEGGRSGYAMVENRQVHYLEWGPAGRPAVLALHGGGQTAYMYEELGKAICDTHHILAPDLPGHGDSDSLPGHALTRHAIAGA